MANFEVVEVPVTPAKNGAYLLLWNALLAAKGKAIRLPVDSVIEFERTYNALIHRSRTAGMRLRRRSLPDGQYLWLEPR